MNIQEKLGNADQLIEQGDFPGAIILYNEITESDPDCNEAWSMLGSLYGETGEIDKAIASLEKAIETSPEDVLSYMVLGQVRNAQGDSDEALRCFLKAIDYDAENTEALCMLASFYQQEGNLSDSIKYFEQVIAIDETLITAWEMLAPLHFNNSDLDQAENCYKKAISLRPAGPEALIGLCSLLNHRSRSNEVLQLLDTLPTSVKKHEEILYLLAIANSREGFHAEALQFINEALEKTSSEKNILGKAEVLQVKSDYQQSFDLLRPYLEIDPPNTQAVLILTKFCKEIELVKETKKLLNRALTNENLTPHTEAEIHRFIELVKEYA